MRINVVIIFVAVFFMWPTSAVHAEKSPRERVIELLDKEKNCPDAIEMADESHNKNPSFVSLFTVATTYYTCEEPALARALWQLVQTCLTTSCGEMTLASHLDLDRPAERIAEVLEDLDRRVRESDSVPRSGAVWNLVESEDGVQWFVDGTRRIKLWPRPIVVGRLEDHISSWVTIVDADIRVGDSEPRIPVAIGPFAPLPIALVVPPEPPQDVEVTSPPALDLSVRDSRIEAPFLNAKRICYASCLLTTLGGLEMSWRSYQTVQSINTDARQSGLLWEVAEARAADARHIGIGGVIMLGTGVLTALGCWLGE